MGGPEPWGWDELAGAFNRIPPAGAAVLHPRFDRAGGLEPWGRDELAGAFNRIPPTGAAVLHPRFDRAGGLERMRPG